MTSVVLLATVLGGFIAQESSYASQESGATMPAGEEPTSVPYCELVENPERYHGTLVQITASLISSSEAGFLYDLQCNSEDT